MSEENRGHSTAWGLGMRKRTVGKRHGPSVRKFSAGRVSDLEHSELAVRVVYLCMCVCVCVGGCLKAGGSG